MDVKKIKRLANKKELANIMAFVYVLNEEYKDVIGDFEAYDQNALFTNTKMHSPVPSINIETIVRSGVSRCLDMAFIDDEIEIMFVTCQQVSESYTALNDHTVFRVFCTDDNNRDILVREVCEWLRSGVLPKSELALMNKPQE